jgi:polar amino acid transport system substrate-binding protein
MKIWLAALLAGAMILGGCTSPMTAVPASNNLRLLTEDYPPYNFLDKSNNIIGQCTEVVQAIMKKPGVQANIEMLSLAEGLSLTEKGPYTAMFSINRTAQRENQYKWVGAIGRYEQAFYAKKGSTITIVQLEDAKKVGKIGVYKGDAGNQYLVSQGFTNLDESAKDSEALKKLVDGKVDLWLGNKMGLAETAKEAGVNPDDVVLLPTVILGADMYIAFSKDVPDSVIAQWQKALDAIKTEQDIDGKTVMDKIKAKYDDPEFVQSLMK